MKMELQTEGIQELTIAFFKWLFGLNFETMNLDWVPQLYELGLPFWQFFLTAVKWL